jgi:hypothetical protein
MCGVDKCMGLKQLLERGMTGGEGLAGFIVHEEKSKM